MSPWLAGQRRLDLRDTLPFLAHELVSPGYLQWSLESRRLSFHRDCASDCTPFMGRARRHFEALEFDQAERLRRSIRLLSAMYTDQALKTPSLTRPEDLIAKWWQGTLGSPNDVLGSVRLGLGPARLVAQRHPQPLGPALHQHLRATVRLTEMNDAPQLTLLRHTFSVASPRHFPNRAFARAPAT